MARQIGSIAPGLQAGIIALDGDPLKDITAVRRVVFVMSGIVYKNALEPAVTHKFPRTNELKSNILVRAERGLGRHGGTVEMGLYAARLKFCLS